LDIYSITGQKIRELAAGHEYTRGNHQFVWDGKNDRGENVASGVYFARASAGKYAAAKKMLLMR
jgi:flagellar hook assembly protein FlgD